MLKTRAAELRFRVINFTDVILCTDINMPGGNLALSCLNRYRGQANIHSLGARRYVGCGGRRALYPSATAIGRRLCCCDGRRLRVFRVVSPKPAGLAAPISMMEGGRQGLNHQKSDAHHTLNANQIDGRGDTVADAIAARWRRAVQVGGELVGVIVATGASFTAVTLMVSVAEPE